MISYAADQGRDFTLVTATGRMTVSLFRGHMKDFLAGSPTRLVLWDFTQADLSEMYEPELDQVFRELSPISECRRNGKTAMVFTRTVDFGVGRMAEIFAVLHDLPYKVQSFWGSEAAEEWLFSDEDLCFDKNLLSLVSPGAWRRSGKAGRSEVSLG